jgi:diadenosine tetraphosphate (Ap4A) HIT family hydrolase
MTEETFDHLKVGQFEHWGVFAHPNQQYLGRCLIWCDRKEALDLTDALPEEWSSFQSVLAHVKRSAADLFEPSWFNYAFLGNEVAHLHAHVIPRYEKTRMFMGYAFPDERYGKNYLSDHAYATPPGVLAAVIDGYRQKLIFSSK